MFRERPPTPKEIANKVTEGLRRNEEAPINHWYKRTQHSPPPPFASLYAGGVGLDKPKPQAQKALAEAEVAQKQLRQFAPKNARARKRKENEEKPAKQLPNVLIPSLIT